MKCKQGMNCKQGTCLRLSFNARRGGLHSACCCVKGLLVHSDCCSAFSRGLFKTIWQQSESDSCNIKTIVSGLHSKQLISCMDIQASQFVYSYCSCQTANCWDYSRIRWGGRQRKVVCPGVHLEFRCWATAAYLNTRHCFHHWAQAVENTILQSS